MSLYFVTHSKEKFGEAKHILKKQVEMIDLDIIEIQSNDIEEVAKDKAEKAYEKVGKPVIVEDTGLYINALNGFPGTMIRWVIETIGIEGICKLVGDADRKAYSMTCFCFYDGKEIKAFTGRTDGRISNVPKGREYFNWDRIFIPQGYDITYAEMDLSLKNTMSSRMKALVQLEAYVDKKVH